MLGELLYHCFKYENYSGRKKYLFDNNDDCAKTLGDSKPKHYHIYIYVLWKQGKKP